MEGSIPKFVNPKYYNWLTKTLLVAGITLLCKPLWEQIVDGFLKNIGISISNENDPIFGLVAICIALIYNLISQYLALRQVPLENVIPQKEISKCKKCESFYQLCQSILPLIEDNKYLFEAFGPNSSANNLEPLRTDLSLWHKSREEYIVPNNDIIYCLINENELLVPEVHQEIFRKLKTHIYAFKKHVENNKFDYSDYQFPKDIQSIIKDTCYNETINTKQFKDATKWIENKLSIKQIQAKAIIGSFLYTTEYSNDVDVLIFLNIFNEQDLRITKYKLDKIKDEFKLKFKRNIHLTVFTSQEETAYLRFINKNDFKYLLNGKGFTLFNYALY
jgi:hypothetical protein